MNQVSTLVGRVEVFETAKPDCPKPELTKVRRGRRGSSRDNVAVEVGADEGRELLRLAEEAASAERGRQVQV